MKSKAELNALLALLDDPDEQVFSHVAKKVVEYSNEVLPYLDKLRYDVNYLHVHDRIEGLIDRVKFDEFSSALINWRKNESDNLLKGAIIIANYFFPDFSSDELIYKIEKIKLDIWQALDEDSNTIEKMRTVSNIFYSHIGFSAVNNDIKIVDHFLINKVVESKSGNQIGNGLLFMVLSMYFDLPIKFIRIPRQILLAYLKPGYVERKNSLCLDNIEFFIEPSAGGILELDDIKNYFRQIHTEINSSNFQYITFTEFIKAKLEAIANTPAIQNNFLAESLATLAKNF